MSPLLQGSPSSEISPPADVDQVVAEELFSLFDLGSENQAMRIFKGAPPEKVGVSDAYELYEVGLESAARNVLRQAKFEGWYYLLYNRSKPIGYLEMALQPDGSYDSGRIGGEVAISSLLDECRFIESLAVVKQKDYFLSYIRVWCLAIFAFWLRPKKGGGDLVVPLPPTEQELRPRPNTLYEGPDFVDRVARIAGRRLSTGLNVIRAPRV